MPVLQLSFSGERPVFLWQLFIVNKIVQIVFRCEVRVSSGSVVLQTSRQIVGNSDIEDFASEVRENVDEPGLIVHDFSPPIFNTM